MCQLVIPVHAGWLVGVCSRLFVLPGSVLQSHVRVVCCKDEPVPVSSYAIRKDEHIHVHTTYLILYF